MNQRELIASALKKLGPERCEQGLVAFEEPERFINFDRCILARAYGPPGALENEAPDGEYESALGITEPELWAVVHAFDGITRMPGSGEVRRAELRQMVEAEAAKAKVQKREPVHV